MLDKLKYLRDNIDWEVEEERHELFDEFYRVLDHWDGRLSDLQSIFQPEQLEILLLDSIDRWDPDEGEDQAALFIWFLVETGYKDKPKVDKDGKLMLCRCTALHRAEYDQCYARELFKIYDRFDINYIDEESGYTHFHVACEWGCKDVVEKFLELGQDPNILVTGAGSSPLHLALMSDDVDPEIVEILLRHGANPSVADKRGLTAVHLISMGSGDSDLMQMLIDLTDNKHQPVRIDLQDEKNGVTALAYAVAHNLKNVTETLLKNGAEVNNISKLGSTPLHTACLENNDAELAKILLKFGARIDAQNEDGRTPLHNAVYRGNESLVEFLLRNGADPNKAGNDGSTALHTACEKNNDAELAKMLLKFGARVDAQNEDGYSPLHSAVYRGNESLVELLLRNGADPNKAGNDGFTPLHVICDKAYDDADFLEKFFKICKDKGQKLQIEARDDKGRTPLQLAVGNILPDMVDVLLNHGADLSSFVFPTAKQFDDVNSYRKYEWMNKLKIASGLLIVVERLEKRGYELVRSDTLTIMEFFIEYDLLASPNVEESWYNYEKFEIEAKKIMVNPSLSLYDLTLLPPKEAAKQFTYEDYSELWRSKKLWDLPWEFRDDCAKHLCEKLTSRFFRKWALYPFWEQILHYRLPILCCDMIIDHLTNKDLFNICLVAAKE